VLYQCVDWRYAQTILCRQRGLAVATGKIGINGDEYIVPPGTREAYERDGKSIELY
jgi:hypothetical protein